MLLEVEESIQLVPEGLQFLSRFLFSLSLQILSYEKRKKQTKKQENSHHFVERTTSN